MPREPLLLATIVLFALVVSGIEPRDRTTWWLEVAPVLLAIPLLVATRARFPLTPLLYRLITIHALILIYGGHYTYSNVPLGFWVQDALGLARNHYDRLGHVAQGFVPAILGREILMRCSPLRGSRWLGFLAASICLAFSAFYELIEWWAALAGGDAAHDFLGTQGDVWDTQWDMFLALCGAITALVLLPRTHDRAVDRLEASTCAS